MVISDSRELTERLAALPAGRRALAAIERGPEEVYLVGGGVRDLTLGRTPGDLDLVVAGDVRPLAARLGEDERSARVHGHFGTATVRGPGGIRYDLAGARTETYARPGALPEIAPAGIREDLRRRDFTVNALALGLSGAAQGRLLAVPEALEDIAARRLRVLHEQSFRDDPTRLLRLARYAGRLGFVVEPGTERLAREALDGGAPATVSGGRIGTELMLLATEAEPVAGFEVMHRLGIDEAIAPGFGIGDPNQVRRALHARAGSSADGAPIVLAAALLGVPDGERRALVDRLGLDRRTRRAALAAAADAPALARLLPEEGPPSRLVAALPIDQPATIGLAAGIGSPGVASALARWFSDYAQVGLDLDGDDLIAAGVRPGPAVSVGLRAALAARLDGSAGTREQQLAAALGAVRDAG